MPDHRARSNHLAEPLPILLVEDEPIIAMTLGDELEEHGFRVEHAADGLDALQRLARGRYHAVISDLRLPGCDGLRVLQHARAASADVELLLITAHATADSAGEARRQQATLLEKPFANRAVLDWLSGVRRTG